MLANTPRLSIYLSVRITYNGVCDPNPWAKLQRLARLGVPRLAMARDGKEGRGMVRGKPL